MGGSGRNEGKLADRGERGVRQVIPNLPFWPKTLCREVGMWHAEGLGATGTLGRSGGALTHCSSFVPTWFWWACALVLFERKMR